MQDRAACGEQVLQTRQDTHAGGLWCLPEPRLGTNEMCATCTKALLLLADRIPTGRAALVLGLI